MKTLRKIITNRVPLTNNEILSQKESFSDLQKRYHPVRSHFKFNLNNVVIMSVAASVIVIAITYKFYINPTDTKKITSKYTMCDTSYFKKPIVEACKYQHFLINNKKDTNLLSSKGSQIHIKANTFVDKDGKTVEGEVELIYNEYHNPVELFLSGIPMKYDSAGVNYTFESAGMFEIYAKKGKEFLAMNDKQPILLDLVSDQKESFNFYNYDIKENRWNYLSSENDNASDIKNNSEPLVNQGEADFTIAPREKENNNKAEAPKQTEVNKTALFSKGNATNSTNNTLVQSSSINSTFIPRKENPDNYSFMIEIEANEFPEFAGYKNMLFEIDNSDSSFKEDYYNVKWSKVNLKRLENDNYLIELSRFKKSISFKAYPVLKSDEYAKAIKDYNKTNVESIAKVEQNMKQIANKKDMQIVAETQNNMINNFQYYRKLSIINLGTYNCDHPLPFPEYPVAITLNIVDKDGKKLDYAEVNIVQSNKKILWKYKSYNKPYVSKSSYNLIWVVTEANQLAIIEIPKNSVYLFSKSFTAEVYPFKEGIEKLNKLLESV